MPVRPPGVRLEPVRVVEPGDCVADPWGVDGPPGATGVLSRGVPPVKGVWGAAPGSPPQAPIFWGFFD